LAIVVRAARAGAVRHRDALADPARLPGRRDYELDDAGLAPCAYDDLDTVRFTRAFLDAPARFVHPALDDLD